MSYSSLEDLLTPSASADDNSHGVRRLLFAYDASDGARNAIRVARGVFNDGEALILCVAKAILGRLRRLPVRDCVPRPPRP